VNEQNEEKAVEYIIDALPKKTPRQRQVEAVARQKEALELRLQGLSYAAIAAKLNYKSPQAAHNAVMSAIKRTLREPADAVRRLECERLDALQAALWQKLHEDPAVADRILRVMERRARLLGLDAPASLEVGLTGIDVSLRVVPIAPREGEDGEEGEGRRHDSED